MLIISFVIFEYKKFIIKIGSQFKIKSSFIKKTSNAIKPYILNKEEYLSDLKKKYPNAIINPIAMMIKIFYTMITNMTMF